MITSCVRWVLATIRDAAMAEMDDDTPLREALLDAGMRRELGEIGEEEYVQIEEELLSRIREIRGRREAAAGPIAFTQAAQALSGEAVAIEASVVGDFYEAPAEPSPSIARLQRQAAASHRRARTRGKKALDGASRG